MLKRIGIILTCVILIFILIKSGTSVHLDENPSSERLIQFFEKNSKIFDDVVTRLKDTSDDISIDKRDGDNIDLISKKVSKSGIVPYKIEEDMKNDISMILYEYGFLEIYKEANFIYFDKYVGFQWHKALVYSIDGSLPNLSKSREFHDIGNGWFYYDGE